MLDSSPDLSTLKNRKTVLFQSREIYEPLFENNN